MVSVFYLNVVIIHSHLSHDVGLFLISDAAGIASFLMWLVLQNFSCANFVMLTLAIGALNLSLKVAG
jgi:uncharacterized membrane protein